MERFAYLPTEIKEARQWVCYIVKDGRKIPVNPHNGRYASVSDPFSWGSFNEALNAFSVNPSVCAGIGFVLTENNQFTCIDLDLSDDPAICRQQELIFNAYKDKTYCELSPNGGLHIWLKSNVFNAVKNPKIEAYSKDRFITITGNQIGNDNQLYFDANFDAFLNWLRPSRELEERIIFSDEEPVWTNEEVYNAAYNAVNGQKFYDLYAGDWEVYYSSQSEADLALINILSFYSKSNSQVAEIFRESALGQRVKAQRDDYIERLIRKSRDKEVAINLPELKDFLEKDKEEFDDEIYQSITPAVGNAGSDNASVANEEVAEIPAFEMYDKGSLMDDIAEYVYKSSPRPVKEFGLAASIALLSGIAGRCFNVSGTGLNQYTLMLAPSGVGKEAMASGINRLIDGISDYVPDAESFLGASDIASPQALIRRMSDGQKSFVCVFGEFGLKMQQMAQPNAAPHLIGLRSVMLDLYNKSGQGQSLRPSIYADKDKNTEAIHSPNFSFLGESTPMRFYDRLSEDMVTEGLLPRFNIIEYEGIRVPFNKGHYKNAVIPQKLKDRLTAFAAQCLSLNERNEVVNVTYSEEAENYLDEIDKTSDDKINGTIDEVERTLWNRVHIKVLKLAALVAVSRNMFNPVINYDDVDFAYKLILQNTLKIVSRFKNVEDESEDAYTTVVNHIWANHQTNQFIHHKELHDKFRFAKGFKIKQHGKTVSLLPQVLKDLFDAGILAEVDKVILRKMGVRPNQKVYEILKHPDRIDKNHLPEIAKDYKMLLQLNGE